MTGTELTSLMMLVEAISFASALCAVLRRTGKDDLYLTSNCVSSSLLTLPITRSSAMSSSSSMRWAAVAISRFDGIITVKSMVNIIIGHLARSTVQYRSRLSLFTPN